MANDKDPAAGREALGRSRGGLSTKIHLTADRRCRPITRILSPGQHGDCPRFILLMAAEGSGGGSLASIFEARPPARELHRSGRG